MPRISEAHLEPHSTQTIEHDGKVANVSIMLLIDQRFCITPPYRTASPGNAHQANEGRGRELPGGISRAQPTRCLNWHGSPIREGYTC